MRSRGALLRAGALIATAALALHQLRYAIGYGLGSPAAKTGHGYLPVAGALAIALLALAMLHLLARATGAQGPDPRMPRFRRTWLAVSAILLAVFVGQELVEGLLTGGLGVAGLVAHAGWSAVPLALTLGALVAAALRGAEHVLAPAPVGGSPSRPRDPEPRRPRPTAAPRPESVLARHLASRAPPLAS